MIRIATLLPSVRPTLRRLGALTAAGVALSAFTTLSPVAEPSAKAATCSGDPVTKTWRKPGTTALGVSQAKTVELIAATRHSCHVKTVKVTISTALFNDTYSMSKYATTGGKDYWGVTYTISPKSVYNAEAGRWRTKYAVKRDSGTYTHQSSAFRVLRVARLTTNATPEPVTRGKTLTVKGTFKLANWESGHYRDFAGQTVQLQRRTSGGYQTVKSVKSNAAGVLSTTTTATTSRATQACYRYRYTGSGTTHAVTSAADCVRLKG